MLGGLANQLPRLQVEGACEFHQAPASPHPLFCVCEAALSTGRETVQMGLLLAGPREASGQVELILGHFWFPGAGQEFCLEGPVAGNLQVGVGLGDNENHGGEMAGRLGSCSVSAVICPAAPEPGSFLGPRCPCLPMRGRPHGP